MSEYVIVSKAEREIRKNEIYMDGAEVQELIEYKDVFIKFIQKKINKIQAELGLCKRMDKEKESYVEIQALGSLIEDINKVQSKYTEYITKEEEK